MKPFFLLIAPLVLVTGCSSFTWWEDEPEAPMTSRERNLESAPKMSVVNVKGRPDNDTAYSSAVADAYFTGQDDDEAFSGMAGQPRYANTQGVYNGKMLTKHVGDYVQNMTQDLISNMEYLSDETPVGVTNFALIDSDLQTTNLLGYQLAESFIHELHKFRIPVIDYKATDYIRVTEAGDFVLSRDFLELSNSAPIEYILTGTMTRHQGGYLVNARIMGLQSKAVVATAQMLVPFYVVDALLPSAQDGADGVRLRQG